MADEPEPDDALSLERILADQAALIAKLGETRDTLGAASFKELAAQFSKLGLGPFDPSYEIGPDGIAKGVASRFDKALADAGLTPEAREILKSMSAFVTETVGGCHALLAEAVKVAQTVGAEQVIRAEGAAKQVEKARAEVGAMLTALNAKQDELLDAQHRLNLTRIEVDAALSRAADVEARLVGVTDDVVALGKSAARAEMARLLSRSGLPPVSEPSS